MLTNPFRALGNGISINLQTIGVEDCHDNPKRREWKKVEGNPGGFLTYFYAAGSDVQSGKATEPAKTSFIVIGLRSTAF